MATVSKIDSNQTGLRYAKETSIGVLPGTPDWIPLEPNSYSDFGGQITTLARRPINQGRRRKKGVTVDFEASGGFNQDLTQTNLQDMLQGFCFAALRRKTEFGGAGEITNVDGANNQYEAASGLDDFLVGDLINGAFFEEGDNNGLKRVTVSTGTAITVAEDIVDEVPPAEATLVQVGFQFATADAVIDVSGSLPALTTTVKDMTEFGIIPGEWVFIGGDAAGLVFANAENNGRARVRSVTANAMVFDKTSDDMTADAGTGKTIQIFFGRVLKDETGGLVVRQTYQLERTLGAPDDSQPSEIQSQYLVGSIANEFNMNWATQDKITVDLAFLSQDVETRTGVVGVKSGNRPDIVEADAFNTSDDVKRAALTIASSDPTPLPLFAFLQELKLNIKNNAVPNKAIGAPGAFEVTAGIFEVSGSMTAYFADVTATEAVRSNEDLTLDLHLVKANSGISFDVPLLSLGDGRPNVEQDQAITLPLTHDAASGAKVHPTLDHTIMFVFFDYLPDLAD